MDCIMEHLYLGDCTAAEDLLLLEKNVHLFIIANNPYSHCGKLHRTEIPKSILLREKFKYMVIPVGDFPSSNLLSYFPAARK